MRTDFIPSTTERVPRHTDETVNERISRQIEANVNFYATQDWRMLNIRLQELDRERDIERMLKANAAAVSLIGLGLGRFFSRRWYLLPAAVAAFLLQYAVQGWCPPVGLLRRLGVRTAQEIDYERDALKALRGDFRDIGREESCSANEALEAVRDN